MAEDPTDPAAEQAPSTPDRPAVGGDRPGRTTPPAFLGSMTGPERRAVDEMTVEIEVVRPRAEVRSGQSPADRYRNREPPRVAQPPVATPKAPATARAAGPDWLADTAEVPLSPRKPVSPRKPAPDAATGPDAPVAGAGAAGGRSSGPAARTAAVDRMRGMAGRYGWLAAATGLAVTVALCSVPFISGAGLTWNSALPAAVATSAPAVAPAAVPAAPSPSAVPTSRSPTPRRTTAKPAPKRSTATSSAPAAVQREPVLLGPAHRWALERMLRDYCDTHYGTRRTLRDGSGGAEKNWECRIPGENPLIDMDTACRDKYGQGVFAGYTDRNDAFSWRCYRR